MNWMKKSDTIKPRLERCGADCRKVAFINEETYSGLTLDDERIRQAIIEFRPRLVVIDPIQAYLGSDSDLQIAGRARKLMKTILAELNMEQFRRVPLYESYMADEITEEQYQAEVLDYEEAHRKLNKQLTAIMENTMVWERALSLRNPWIQQMEQYKTPEALDRNFVKKYIEQVVVTFLGDRQAEISLTMKTEE